jgi:hypothetical protein
MTPCQKRAQLRKIKGFQMKVEDALRLMAEQRSRAEYFQGLVNQIRAAMKEEQAREKDD